MASIIVKDTAGLTAALKSAQSGDTIKLAAGDYAGFAISGVKFAGAGVTITSLDPANEAKLDGFQLRGCEGLNFKNLEFYSDPLKTNPYQVIDSARINFDNLDVHGSLDGDCQNDSSGLYIKNSQNVTVTNSEFHQLEFAIANNDSKYIKIDGNKFHEIQFDGVRGGGTSHITVSNNYFTNFDPKAKDHPDAIQFWTARTTASATDITITGNIILRGDGAATQGIFFRDQVGNLPFKNLTITDNIIIGGSPNGIRVNGADGVTIANNTVGGLADQSSAIGIESAAHVTLTNNKATHFAIETGTVTDLVQQGSTLIGSPTDGGAALVKAYLAAHPTSPLSAWAAEYVEAAGDAMMAMNALRADVQTVNGTSLADKLVADVTRDTVINAGAGNDLITSGGVGHNTLVGGEGDDSYRVGANDVIIELVGGGNDTVTAAVDYTLADHVERLNLTGAARSGTGSEQNNTIIGTAEGDTLSGMGGDDHLQSNGGSDNLLGGAGNDTLYGGDGADTLQGGEGADRFRGDEGSDSLSGGGGVDNLGGGTGADTLAGGEGADVFAYGEGDIVNGETIFDFSRAQGDKINVQTIDANVNAIGNQTFGFIGTAAFTKVAGQLRYEVSGSDSYVMGDMNGDGLADLKILVKGVNSFQSSDFIL